MPANAGQRNLLLERKTHVRAPQHERQVIEGGREHRVGEGGDDRGPLLAGAKACAHRLYLVAPLAGEPNGVAEAQRRRQHGSRLCRRRRRRSRGPDHEENSEGIVCFAVALPAASDDAVSVSVPTTRLTDGMEDRIASALRALVDRFGTYRALAVR